MLYFLIDMRKLLFFFTLSLLLYSCNDTEQSSEQGLFIDNGQFVKGQIGNVFKTHKLIHLDATVNRIDDLVLADDRMVVIDRSMESLYIFNREGSLIKQVQGDLLSNGKFVQPVCVSATKNGDLLFYEAANQMIFRIDQNNEVSAYKEADFYIRKLYPYKDGFLAFKNQSVQNEESEEYWFDIIEIDSEFNFIQGFFPFEIEKNVARTWQYFDDPVNVTAAGFEFYQPLTSTYTLTHTSGAQEEYAISFDDRSFKDRHLETVNREDAFEVLEKIFNRYALLNAKKLESGKITAVRYVDAGKVYYNMDVKGKGPINYSEFTLSVDDKDLPVPYPMIVQAGKWYSVLDLENYDAMNLQQYDDVHPVLDQVIEGQTYLLELSL